MSQEVRIIGGSVKLFKYYRGLGQKVINRLDQDAMHHRLHPEDNSVATIVKHLHGNMLSRWTDFLTSDGEKDWRKRDEEFETTGNESLETLQRWFNEGWDCVMNALEPLGEEQIGDIIYIRNEGHTVIEAIQRQLAHYAYHTGQMVTIAKSILGEGWQSLSIPKGNSVSYNQNKLAQDKRRSHFTDNNP